MKILSAHQIRQADSATIKNEPISSIDLMERAAGKCTRWFLENFASKTEFKIFCGLGNNGADGLAIARQLIDKRFENVEAIIIRHSEVCSEDFLVNEKRLPKTKIINIKSVDELGNIKITPDTVIVDCIFGTGLNKPAQDLAAETISFVNYSKSKIISIDIPSGMFCDEVREGIPIVKANFTLSFQQPKLSFLFRETESYIGKLEIIDIGIDKKFIENCPAKSFVTTDTDAKNIYEPRKKFSHKGTYGHALIVAGSEGKIGAAILAVKACMRAGAGLTTIHLPKCGYVIMQETLPEAMTRVDSNERFISDTIHLEKYNAIGIGPGLGTEKQTASVLKLLIQNSSLPIVLDADALNILSENKTWLAFLPKGSILTPHPKEFDRLAGNHSSTFERWKSQKEFSVKHGVYIVLKGANTSITTPEGIAHFNSTGNPGMAKGGSGDVLTGIITALLAQGYSPKDGLVFGVYLHGLAGDIAAKAKSEEAMLASDLIDSLGEAFRKVKG